MGASVFATLGGGLLQGIGSGIGQAQQAKVQKKQADNDWKMSSGQEASQLQHQQDTAPIRDQAMYLLQQRLGMTPQTFQPHDLYNQRTSAAAPQYGGYNPQQLQTAQQSYTPGAGGVNTAVNQQAIGGIGYGTTQSNPLSVAQGNPAPGPAEAAAVADKQAQIRALGQKLGLHFNI